MTPPRVSSAEGGLIALQSLETRGGVKKAAIGVDIGGTSVKLGLVNPRGQVALRDSFLTGHTPGRAGLLNLLVSHIRRFGKEAARSGFKVLGVGIGAPGPIDVRKGLVHFFPNIPGWRNTPLKKILQSRTHLPVWVDNDAGVMALAEYFFGAGRGSRNVIALTLGTGIGGGLVIDGKLFSGPAFSAAEVGHIIINEKGRLCACGNRGCVEAYVGGRSFIREVKARLKKGAKSVLSSWLRTRNTALTPLLVAQAARRGDPFSKKIWRETGEHLGTALAGLCNVLNPEKIILGGGMAGNGRLIFGPVIATIRKKAFPIAARSVKVVPAKLGVDAGLVGAAALVFSNKGTREAR